MELALGTVQFGLAYGVAGRREAVPSAQAREILARAWSLGIRTLDTASAYGNIEERLAELCGPHDFGIVSKVPPLPPSLDGDDCCNWALEHAERSRLRLGRHLRALMLHRADDLLESRGGAMWSALASWGAAHHVSVGASCYEPAKLGELSTLPGFAIAQVPGNALDQRVVRDTTPNAAVSVHLRSALLQGLLVLDLEEASRKVPQSAEALARWRRWCRDHGLDALTAALSVVKSFHSVDACVVGVDDLGQLEQIAQAWSIAAAVQAPELHCERLDVIDPRRWSST